VNEPATRPGAPARNSEYDLRLYVAGTTPKSIVAFQNLQQLCQDNLAGRYRIKVIDLMKNPSLAKSDDILAVPTLVRRTPAPIRKVIGTLSNAAHVLAGLELRPLSANPFLRKTARHV